MRATLTALRARCAREDGYIILIVLALLMIGLAASAAALDATLNSRTSSDRQLRVKRALQAADAGVQVGTYRWNQLDLTKLNFTTGLLSPVTSLLDCVVPSLSPITGVLSYATPVGIDVTTGACPAPDKQTNPIPDTQRLGHHTFTYIQYVPGAASVGPNDTLNPKIVATGVDDNGNSSTCSSSLAATAAQTSGCVVQRVEATLAPIDPFQLVEATGNLNITASALATVAATGDMRTNGSATISSLSFVGTNLFGGSLLSNITYGTTKSVPLVSTATLTKASSSVNRPVIAISSSKADCAEATNPAASCSTVFGSAYVSATKSLKLTSGALTIPAGDYVFCNVNITGGTVITTATATQPVRIYVDSPTSARCNGLASGEGNFTDTTGLTQNAISGVSTLLASSQVQLYVVGNGTGNGTTVQIGPSGGGLSLLESMFIYAPQSTVNIGTTIFDGNVVGDNVNITATALTQNLGLDNYSLDNGVGVFHPIQYSSCSPKWPPSTTASPTVGC